MTIFNKSMKNYPVCNVDSLISGAIHKDHCPAERFIPIYLIVAGAFGIVKNLSTLGQRARNKDKDDKDEQNAKTNPFDGLVSCFLFAWFIAGMLMRRLLIVTKCRLLCIVCCVLSAGLFTTSL